jgi:hypothetical protein
MMHVRLCQAERGRAVVMRSVPVVGPLNSPIVLEHVITGEGHDIGIAVVDFGRLAIGRARCVAGGTQESAYQIDHPSRLLPSLAAMTVITEIFAGDYNLNGGTSGVERTLWGLR